MSDLTIPGDSVLVDVVAKMEALERSDDTETAHGEADDLLLLAIQRLAERCGKLRAANALTAAYAAVEKWYT